MIVTADLHLKEESEDIVFDEVLPGLVAGAVEHGGMSPMDEHIAILGDIYHVRYRVSVRLQNRLLDFLDKAPTQFLLMPGNHDQINPAGEHALEVFRELDNVAVISEPEWNLWGLWIPYRKDPEDIRRALSIPRPANCPPIGWMHHGIQGAWMNDNIRDTDGLPMEYFAGLQQVFLGHYHKPQGLGSVAQLGAANIVYIGSPYQTRADEAGQQKQYGIWNMAKYEMAYVPVNWGRKFHRLEVTTDSPLIMAEGVCPRDEVRIRTGPGVNPEELGKNLAAQGFTNVVVTPAQEVTKARLQVDPGKGTAAYAQEYVNQFAGDLDQKRLMALFQEIAG